MKKFVIFAFALIAVALGALAFGFDPEIAAIIATGPIAISPEVLNTELATLKGAISEKMDAAVAAAKEGNKQAIEDLKSEMSNIQTKLQDEVEKIPELKEQLAQLDAKLQAKQKDFSIGKNIGKTAQEVLLEEFKADEDYFKSLREASRGTGKGSKDYKLKAVGNMTFGNLDETNAAAVDRQYIPGIFGNVRRRVRVRSAIPQGTMSGDSIPYLVEDGTGEGTVVTVDEGTDKPQIDKDVVVKKADAIKIAAYSRISEELLTDLPAISSFITRQVVEDIYDKEDQQLLFGTGSGTPTQLGGLTTASGVLTAANVPASLTSLMDQNIDAIVGAQAALAANEYMADTLMMNPVDCYGLQLIKETDGQYLNRIQFVGNGQLVINGLPVIQTTAITAGSFLVAEMNRAAQMFQRAGLSVRFYDQDQDNAIKNLVTIVMEERIALAIPYADAIFYDAFADVTALT